jgi:hypothetical protein
MAMTSGEARSGPGSVILVIALSALGLGMMVTIAGILAGPLVLPGVVLIMIGFALLAVAGVLQLRSADPDAPSAAETTRPAAGRRKS